MAFVLIARTTGDDLFPAKDKVVAESSHRQRLEDLRDTRATERKIWLARNPVPYGAQCSVIASERIEEVPTA